MSIKIGIDLMQSDTNALHILKSIIEYSQSIKKDVEFIFFADEKLKSSIEDLELSVNVKFSKNSIAMDEDPLLAIRRKKDSTMFEGLRDLKDDNIDCFISCGNTGALAAGATHILSTFKTISRPALLAIFPTKSNLLAILDVGASIAFETKNLTQFAMLGVSFQKAKNIKNPKVGLLNIGIEKKKGTSLHQKAYLELSKMKEHFNFVGNVEANEVFDGKVDVLITDGFTGNIFLKTSEGLATFVLDKIEKNILKQKSEVFDVLKDLKKRLYYGEYPGAVLMGVQKLVIKCHGYSSIKGIISAIDGAINLVENNFIESIKSNLE